MPECVVFAGASLPPEDRGRPRSGWDVRWLPPIKRGDLDAAIDGGPTPDRVLIIDGEFMQALAVTPKEVVRALDAGVQVHGSSSMGAMRAAECESFGAVPVGEIARLYADGWLFGDDEVAMTYRPDGGPGSEPLVNVRFALRDAVRDDAIDPAEAETLLGIARDLYFPELSFPRLEREADRVVPDASTRFSAWVARHSPNQKRTDAREALRVVLEEPEA